MARSVGLLLALVVSTAVVFVRARVPDVTDSLVNADMQAHIAARTAPWANLTNFSFGVFSDIHMIDDPGFGLSRPQWQRLIQRWRDAGDLFGLIIGDLGYGQPNDISNVLSGPASVSNPPPIFYGMGNHELDGHGKRRWIDGLYPGAVQPGSWTVSPAYMPGNGDHVYFSFNVGPSTHFIVLDGDYMTFDGFNARMRQSFGQAQLTWLAADIAANANRNILVFVHEPIEQQVTGSTPYFLLSDRGSLMDLLAAHPRQKYVFSGHYHTFQGTTLWRGVTSVHVMWGTDPNYGVRVVVNGDQITLVSTGATTNFDNHPMNQVETINNQQVIKVREDGTPAGFTRGAEMAVTGPENGVAPTSGTLMLKATNVNWYNPRHISEQLIKVLPGMRLSYDIYLHNVVLNKDAVTVQPDWYMKNGQMPPRIADQNNVPLSQRSKDGLFFIFSEDVAPLGGRATGRWYHREFDLAPVVGHYVDGLYLTSRGGFADVGTVYVDNIRFTTGNVSPTVSLTSPPDLATFPMSASIPVTATAFDTDGSIARVDFFASGGLIGSRSTTPYSLTWTGMAAGTYNVSAVAVDNLGATTTSTVARVSVVPNTPPTVSLTSPGQGATFQAPGPITVTAAAADVDGSVTRVDFYANGSPIGNRTVAPYSITWSGVPAGNYTLTAVATDNQAATATSSPVAITVSAPAVTGSLVNANLQAHIAARTAPWANLTNFSFGVFSDIHMIDDPGFGLSRPQWQRLIQRWRDAGDLFGLIIGDLGYGQPNDISNVLSGPASVSNPPSIFYGMGNHDLDGHGKRRWIDGLYPGAVQPGSWTVNPAYMPGNGDHVYFSFNVGPSTHFIVLDGDYMTFDGYNARMRQSFGQAQLTWLAADIAANANRNILVFVHEPIDQQVTGSTPYFLLSDRGSLMDLLAAHPRQKYVFSGHYHAFQGTTLWRGVTSVHVMWGTDPNYGVRVVVNGDQITLVSTGATTNFDNHPMNQVETINNQQVIKVREDGTPAGLTGGADMAVTGPENGVAPTSGALMLKATNVNWYKPRHISEQLIKVLPGMRFSYDIYLHNVVLNKDAVTVQPDWYMKNGQMPPRIADQNNVPLSQRSKDGLFFIFNEDLQSLGGRATGRWYHREFDLAPVVGHYVDGLYLTSGSGTADVGTVYVDNIRFTTGNLVDATPPLPAYGAFDPLTWLPRGPAFVSWGTPPVELVLGYALALGLAGGRRRDGRRACK